MADVVERRGEQQPGEGGRCEDRLAGTGPDAAPSPLHVVVCVKAVPGSTEVKMDPVTHTIVRDGGQAVINPFDASALELALLLKDARAARGERTRVTLLSMGIPATAELLRDGIARGADDAVLLSDRAFAGADTLATTHALTCGLARIGMPDLVLCGKMAVDGDTAQIGPELAGALDVPCLPDVRALCSCGDGTVRARCGVEDGEAELEAPLPAVLTVAKEAAALRMPSIAGVRAAAGAPVAIWGAADVGADVARIGLAGSPTQVVRSFVPERQVQAEVLAGTPAEQAAQIAAIVAGEVA